MKKILMVGAAALCVFAAGCTDLKPIQSQIDDLKSQVSKLSTSQDGVKAAADSAARAAQDAKTAAQQAASKADAAMSLGQDNKQRIDGLDEKIERMFKKSVSK
jgi:murein lipoprotein